MLLNSLGTSPETWTVADQQLNDYKGSLQRHQHNVAPELEIVVNIAKYRTRSPLRLRQLDILYGPTRDPLAQFAGDWGHTTCPACRHPTNGPILTDRHRRLALSLVENHTFLWWKSVLHFYGTKKATTWGTLHWWLFYDERSMGRSRHYGVGWNCSEPKTWTCGVSEFWTRLRSWSHSSPVHWSSVETSRFDVFCAPSTSIVSIRQCPYPHSQVKEGLP